MGFDEGSVILDSDNDAYYAGQTVYGRIVFNQEKAKTIHGIYVSCKGYCKVHWVSTRSNHRRDDGRELTETVSHDSYEEYFKRKTFIVGSADGEHHLQQGHHEFRFDCPIPSNCPSSFESSLGHIRYRIKVVMVTSGIFSSNKEKLVPIKVHAPLDLNQNPNLREPIEAVIVSHYCCWCMNSGSSEVRVKLPVSGYCAGQVIPMAVSVQNHSNVDIDELSFAIKKIVKYEAMNVPGTRHEKGTICTMKKGPVPGYTSRNWNLEMNVPAMDIYNLNACRFIDITYYFEVNTSVGGCHEDGEDSHLITFGTVPLVGFEVSIENLLHDQLPKTIELQNPLGSNCYPPPPIINQPLPNPYPKGNYPQNTPGGAYPTPPNVSPYPQPAPPINSPHPNTSPNPGYPNNTPYLPGPQSIPGSAPGYPGHTPSPYPQGHQSTPGSAPGYPGHTPSPYPQEHQSTPGPAPGYPGHTPSPYSQGHQSSPGSAPGYPGQTPSPYLQGHMGTPNVGQAYPGNNFLGPHSTPSSAPGFLGPPANSPYPPGTLGTPHSAPGYPGVSPAPPYPGVNPGNIGFVPASGDPAAVPLLPSANNAPYPIVTTTSPYQGASAPEPSTPDIEPKAIDMNPPNSPYNPEFTKSEKKEEN